MPFVKDRVCPPVLLCVVSLFFLCVPHLQASVREAGGVTFSPADTWHQNEIRGGMRLYEFQIPGGEPEASAELAVFFFGPGQGGDVDANIERWKGQFELKEGFTPQVEKIRVNDLVVTKVHLEGKYRNTMMSGSRPAAGSAMLGAVVEGPKGPVFFKMTGPEATVLSARTGFEELIRSLQKA